MTDNKCFLVLDDDQRERALMAHMVLDAFHGARVLEAIDVTSAEEMLGAHDIDCMIVDYNMPLMDGLTFAERMRQLYLFLPIILVTAVGDEMLAARSLRSGGVSDYIPKSRITVDSIRRVITRAVHISTQARVIDEQRNELESFAYALAHDFKQPIRQIRTFTQLVAKGIGQAADASMQQHLAFLSEAARRLGSLVDVMSQYTLLNRPPELSAIDLNRVVDNVRSSLFSFLQEKRAMLVAQELPHVVGNETLMVQVLQNLIVNGIKYNKSAAPRVEIEARDEGDGVVIAVRDNGIGIEEKYQTEIFKPLMRLHTNAEYTGTGLGLTLSRKAVGAQGGTIWCTSQPGDGSTFYMRLAKAKSAPQQKGVEAA